MASPGCFMDTATEFARGKITATEFLHRCLSHLGPPAHRVHHPEDDEDILDAFARVKLSEKRLFDKGQFGPAAAAIQLCLLDPLASSVDVEALLPLFVACISGPQGQDANVSSAARLAQVAHIKTIPASPLFRQALMITALCNYDYPLAKELIRQSSPPPTNQCVFSMKGSLLEHNEAIPVHMWAEIIAAAWAKPSRHIVFKAPQSQSAKDGIALLEAIRTAGYDITSTEPDYKELLPAISMRWSEPAMVQYLWDAFSIPGPPSNDILIDAVSGREAGVVDILAWLLDQGLDVNWLKTPPGPYNTDPRERVEIESARSSNLRSKDPLSLRETALHRASHIGHVEAVELLLARGALPTALDGLGQTPRVLANRKGHAKIVQLLDEHTKPAEDGTS